ncbi:hypothetical protein AUJ40_01565 [Candidatus Berkelbacteria bacterium CG1_02_42_45]|uniref:GIY-YIG domain-containing protein n=1 Tax=Candidatus Berkelbacteria bacterium CG1_02_42_45 TaxID=1805036 RepID=A0A1J4RUM2_9BACT|nr:MAG: hypothetical protein AUJ40_01565 [Candidatus Berkelbacteria bacterium CG1_02_42_45]
MYCLYIIRSIKSDRIYIGVAKDLRARILSHNNRENFATKPYAPWKLIYCEAYLNKKLAFEREKQLKRHAKALTILKKRIGLE